MIVTHSIDPLRRLVTLVYHGNPTPAEAASTMDAVLLDPVFQPGFNFLLDRRDSADVAAADYVRRAANIMELHRRQLRGSRWAMVVSGKAAYGMGRMAQALVEPLSIEFEVFKNLDEAMVWLDRAGVQPRT